MARFCKFLSRSLLPFYLFTLLLLSCQEGREAGDLWGQWRQSGTDNRYISFSGSVTLFRDGQGTFVYGKFQHTGDSLFIQCSSIDCLASDTAFVEDAFGLKPFTDIRLKIENLDGDDLILSQGSKTWSYYKY